MGHHELTFTESAGPHVYAESGQQTCDSETRSCPEPYGKLIPTV